MNCEFHKITGVGSCVEPAVGKRIRDGKEVPLCREHFDSAKWCHDQNVKQYPALEQRERFELT